jgi:hypothetical protein
VLFDLDHNVSLSATNDAEQCSPVLAVHGVCVRTEVPT